CDWPAYTAGARPSATTQRAAPPNVVVRPRGPPWADEMSADEMSDTSSTDTSSTLVEGHLAEGRAPTPCRARIAQETARPSSRTSVHPRRVRRASRQETNPTAEDQLRAVSDRGSGAPLSPDEMSDTPLNHLVELDTSDRL